MKGCEFLENPNSPERVELQQIGITGNNDIGPADMLRNNRQWNCWLIFPGVDF